MKKYLFAAVVILLTGCASTKEKDYDEYAQSVIGNSKEALIKNMGMPTREYKISDKLHLLHYDYSTRNSYIARRSNNNWALALFFEAFFNGGRTTKYVQFYIDENNKIAEVKHKNMP